MHMPWTTCARDAQLTIRQPGRFPPIVRPTWGSHSRVKSPLCDLDTKHLHAGIPQSYLGSRVQVIPTCNAACVMVVVHTLGSRVWMTHLQCGLRGGQLYAQLADLSLALVHSHAQALLHALHFERSSNDRTW